MKISQEIREMAATKQAATKQATVEHAGNGAATEPVVVELK
jgi:hypothetical protein